MAALEPCDSKASPLPQLYKFFTILFREDVH